MPEEIVRPIAICVFRREGKIFVAEGYDAVKEETFYRPLGGTIEFGEYASKTIERELDEEIGQKITNARYLGLSENIFTHLGKPGHEIVLIYEADFADESIYHKDEVIGQEGSEQFKAKWMPMSDFIEGRYPLYPDGIIQMINM